MGSIDYKVRVYIYNFILCSSQILLKDSSTKLFYYLCFQIMAFVVLIKSVVGIAIHQNIFLSYIYISTLVNFASNLFLLKSFSYYLRFFLWTLIIYFCSFQNHYINFTLMTTTYLNVFLFDIMDHMQNQIIFHNILKQFRYILIISKKGSYNLCVMTP